MSSRSNPAFKRYFPKADGPITHFTTTVLPPPPREVGPVFDSERSHEPIGVFDEATHTANFTDTSAQCSINRQPPLPESFADHYLYPSLTRNERLRLTMLWYHAGDVVEDHEFLLRLQEKLDLVHAFMGWEFAIVGLINEHTFTRVATVGLPLAILPRRESTCSHTVNQPSGVSQNCAIVSGNACADSTDRLCLVFPT